MDYNFIEPTTAGVHAVIMPMHTRRIDLRVLYVPPSNAIHTAAGMVVTPWLELSPASWVPLPEGEVAEQPFASGYSRERDDKGPMAILQAMVDLGHKLGLTPTGAEDRSKEIAALRYHLEDMRKLALK